MKLNIDNKFWMIITSLQDESQQNHSFLTALQTLYARYAKKQNEDGNQFDRVLHTMCCSRKKSILSLWMFFWFECPHPLENSSLASYFSLKNEAFKNPNPLVFPMTILRVRVWIFSAPIQYCFWARAGN